MDNYLTLLKRVAKVLVAVGAIDIAYMAYCIAKGQSYSSSLNVFALIAGIFLWRGHLGAVRIVTRFSAFMLAAATGMVFIIAPIMQPTRLWLVQLTLHPWRSMIGMATALAMLCLAAWVYQQLRSPPVLQALARSGRPTAPPRVAFGFGVALPIILAVTFHFTLDGEAGVKAVEMARAKYGDQYQYAPNAIHWSDNHVSAQLTAFNDHEIKTVAVEWTN